MLTHMVCLSGVTLLEHCSLGAKSLGRKLYITKTPAWIHAVGNVGSKCTLSTEMVRNFLDCNIPSCIGAVNQFPSSLIRQRHAHANKETCTCNKNYKNLALGDYLADYLLVSL